MHVDWIDRIIFVRCHILCFFRCGVFVDVVISLFSYFFYFFGFNFFLLFWGWKGGLVVS